VEVPPGTRTNPVWTKPHGLFLKDNFFSKLFTIRQQSPPESAYVNSLKGMRIHRDGSLAHAERWEQSQIPKNSLSGIGHIAKMTQISYWAQLWFGLGTIPDHEPRARVLSVSRTRQFSNHDHGSFSTSVLLIHPGFNALNDQKLARAKSTSLSFLDINGRLYDSSMTRV
jgi:hypothetical protein